MTRLGDGSSAQSLRARAEWLCCLQAAVTHSAARTQPVEYVLGLADTLYAALLERCK